MSSHSQLAKKPSATAENIGMIREAKHFVSKMWGFQLNAKGRFPGSDLFTLFFVLCSLSSPKGAPTLPGLAAVGILSNALYPIGHPQVPTSREPQLKRRATLSSYSLAAATGAVESTVEFDNIIPQGSLLLLLR